jgi:3-oxoacyl-(acyl-carrier-protein) synthase
LPRAFITSMGIVSPLGIGVPATVAALHQGRCAIHPLTLFESPDTGPLPVGEVPGLRLAGDLPRTHQLALHAAREALAGDTRPLDAIVMGVTTGGMLTTEAQLKQGRRLPMASPYHAAGSVADVLAQEFGCRGPVLTVTTACSSGAAAFKLALDLIRRGEAQQVLAGGADSLCRLTYYGFNSLQIVDPQGARPLDRNRRGMSVAEGAALLVLHAAEAAPSGALAELRGGGLSCDAHHPAAPHPDGLGARSAMSDALQDAGMGPADITYINLHGTGTRENDLSEARAVRHLFQPPLPPLSSIKGSCGHSLAASGAIEAVVAVLAIQEGLLPANVGFREMDEAIGLVPVREPTRRRVDTVLSNAFGFGGNNAALVFSRPRAAAPVEALPVARSLGVRRFACLTGAGDTAQTLARLARGEACRGQLPEAALTADMPAHAVRRTKRLARMTLGLAHRVLGVVEAAPAVHGIYYGTGWGALSETHDFLDKLYASKELFTSPIDFVGSVHNAPAGQIAIRHQVRGPNLTLSGGDASFEQALSAAWADGGNAPGPLLVGAADELHPLFSALFDPSVTLDEGPSDGGGLLLLEPGNSQGLQLRCSFLRKNPGDRGILEALLDALGGPAQLDRRFGAILAGIPAALRARGEAQLEDLLAMSRFAGPVVDYRRLLGEYASASAVAAVVALAWVEAGALPPALCRDAAPPLNGRGILVLGLGADLAAMEARMA